MTLPIPRRALLAGAAAAALAAPHVARAAARVLRLGHNNTDTSHYGQGAAAFAAAVAADPVLSGVIRIEVRGGAELGDELSMLKDCAQGTLDMMICSNSVIGNLVREAGLVNAPFIFRDVANARATMDGPVGTELGTMLKAKNVILLAWGENGLRHVTANIPVRGLADLKGLKIRVPQSDVMLGGFRALGADPAPLSFTELREALRSGRFQAQENPIGVIEAAKLYEMQKCLSLTGHIYDPAAFLSSSDTMDDLTPPQRSAMASCAARGAATTRSVAEAAQAAGVQRLSAAGMTVITDVDVASLRAASQPYLHTLSASYGDFLNRLVTAGA